MNSSTGPHLKLRRARILLPALLVLSLLPFVANSADAQEKRVVLGKSLTVTADGPAALPLTVPEDLQFTLKRTDNPNFDIEVNTGGGTFALVEDARNERGVFAASKRDVDAVCPEGDEDCAEFMSRWAIRTFNFDFVDGFPILPAADYRLYLIPDDTMSVTITFPQLPPSETTVVEATPHPDVHVARPDDRSPLPTDDALYYTGAEAEITGQGLFWAITAVRGGATGPARGGHCVYAGGAPNDDVAYAPGCPRSDQQGGFDSLNAGTSHLESYDTIFANVAPNTYGLGAYFIGASTIDKARTTLIWLTY